MYTGIYKFKKQLKYYTMGMYFIKLFIDDKVDISNRGKIKEV